MRALLFSCIAIFTVIFWSGCTITTTKTRNPVFISQEKLESELMSIVTSDNVNLNGQEITKNKKTTSELEISVTNGKNIPSNEDEMKSLGKSIATCVKRNLKDANQFNTYKVLFVTSMEKNGITKRTWTGNVFSSEEL